MQSAAIKNNPEQSERRRAHSAVFGGGRHGSGRAFIDILLARSLAMRTLSTT